MPKEVRVLAGTAAALSLVVATPASAETFTYVAPTMMAPTPSAQTTVPAGMNFASVEMFGAQGGGKGARVTAVMAVTPGETLRVFVGGVPTNGAVPPLSTGGYNGGGEGGFPGSSTGAGGGASDIRRGTALADRLVVAGGGGGDAAPGTGGASGTAGQDGGTGAADGKGGGAGGSGGKGGAAGASDPGFPFAGTAGGDGTLGRGANANFNIVGSSGAGGGGVFGGGGGGGGGFMLAAVGSGGGGGGGSSLAPRGTVTEGVRAGNGEVTITYSAIDPDPPAQTGSGGGVGTSGTTDKDTVKPALGAFGLSRSAFAAAPSGASVSAKKRKKTPVATRVSYTLSEAATVRFTVQLKSAGRKSGKKCVKPTRKNRKKGKCTRWVNVSGSFSHSGKAGRNSFTFRGRVAGKKLKTGTYRLNGTAKDPAGNSSAVRQKTFRIIK